MGKHAGHLDQAFVEAQRERLEAKPEALHTVEEEELREQMQGR